MFITYAEYVQTATQLLETKPKGMGYSNGTGVVLLLAGVLCYVEPGDDLHDASEGDLSEWDEASSMNEFSSLRCPEFVQRFKTADVLAYEQTLSADSVCP